ncbi:hypothetical protein J2Z53_000118 [Clostridium moniliforme]|uniref:DUF4044 domain-containing protein n=2 Tax=Eubacteriales TaxID=186802 RepID=A0ABT9US01_9FIRM|nr:hypothetical protein [Clostridium moniliforme]MDQ0148919.1 hypothetical protein [Eubacterium multiforme]
MRKKTREKVQVALAIFLVLVFLVTLIPIFL